MILSIGSEHDLFALRQQGREIAVAVGLPDRDVTRFAAALSEVGRQVFGQLGPVTIAFETRGDGEAALEVTASAPVPPDFAGTGELGSLRRLVDSLEQDGDRIVARMVRRLPAPAAPLRPAPAEGRVEELAARYAELAAELAETNRGVLALYA